MKKFPPKLTTVPNSPATANRSRTSKVATTTENIGRMKKLNATQEVVNEPIPQKKEKAKPKPKKTECYIYSGRLKTHPEIQLTQIRFKSFSDLESCEAVCDQLFVAYTIKDEKNNNLKQVK